jgi:hypothetical protein
MARLMIGVDLHGLKFEKQKDGAFGVTKYLNGSKLLFRSFCTPQHF